MKLFWTNNIYRQLLLNSCFFIIRRQYFLPRHYQLCGSVQFRSASDFTDFHFRDGSPTIATLSRDSRRFSRK